MFVNDGSRSILSRRQIGHLVKDGDNGLMASGEDLCLLLVPLPPLQEEEEFFLELADESLADLFRFERFSSCLRSELLFEKSEPFCSTTKFCFE